jgi:hypothetical protein
MPNDRMPIHSPKPSKSSQLSSQFAPQVLIDSTEGSQSDAQGGGGLISLRAADAAGDIPGIRPSYTAGVWDSFVEDSTVA